MAGWKAASVGVYWDRRRGSCVALISSFSLGDQHGYKWEVWRGVPPGKWFGSGNVTAGTSQTAKAAKQAADKVLKRCPR